MVADYEPCQPYATVEHLREKFRTAEPSQREPCTTTGYTSGARSG